jgi:hypothetical protein
MDLMGAKNGPAGFFPQTRRRGTGCGKTVLGLKMQHKD